MSIPITKPLFGDEELQAVQRPLESGWVVQGPFVAEFERKFGAFTGAVHSIATSNCTTALHIAVAALGLKPGDEVIVPAFTWVSTANVVEYMGARPIFCDIDLDTFNINVTRIESLITPQTVGIIPVHLFGLCADMNAVRELASHHSLWVVEDAACGFGSRYNGRHAGTLSDVGCFSFHPRKSITTGEGGMVTTSRADVDSLARSLRDHGASRSDLSRHTGQSGFLLAEYDVLGYNYRMTDIQAAVGCVQLDRAEGILSSRQRLAHRYDDRLAAVDWLATPFVPEECEHAYQAYVCLFQPERPSLDNVDQLHAARNHVMAKLESERISTRQGTHAPVLQGYYVRKYGLSPEEYPNSLLADRLSLALPLYAQMTDDEHDTVCDSLVRAIDG